MKSQTYPYKPIKGESIRWLLFALDFVGGTAWFDVPIVPRISISSDSRKSIFGKRGGGLGADLTARFSLFSLKVV